MSVAYFMAVIVVVIVIAGEEAFARMVDLVAGGIIMHSAKETFTAVADLRWSMGRRKLDGQQKKN